MEQVLRNIQRMSLHQGPGTARKGGGREGGREGEREGLRTISPPSLSLAAGWMSMEVRYRTMLMARRGRKRERKGRRRSHSACERR